MNRAANDYLELLLEAGAAAAVVFLLFIAWFAVRSVKIWRRSSHREKAADAFDLSLARTGTVIVATLLLHSIVDFPLRTTAMMAVLAFACAVMVDPVVAPPRTTSRRGPGGDRDKNDTGDPRWLRRGDSLLDLGRPARQESHWRAGESRCVGARQQ